MLTLTEPNIFFEIMNYNYKGIYNVQYYMYLSWTEENIFINTSRDTHHCWNVEKSHWVIAQQLKYIMNKENKSFFHCSCFNWILKKKEFYKIENSFCIKNFLENVLSFCNKLSEIFYLLQIRKIITFIHLCFFIIF